jgi:hypothetical protein
MEKNEFLIKVKANDFLCSGFKCAKCPIKSVCDELFPIDGSHELGVSISEWLRKEYKKMMVLKWRYLVNEKSHK